jgi:hypothetical protein
MRPLALTCCLTLAACGPGGGTTDTADTTSTTAPGTTSTTDTTASTSPTSGGTTAETTTTDPLTTSATGSTTTMGSTSFTTTPPTTDSSTGPIDTTTTDPGTSTTSSTGGGGVCKPALGDYGDCDLALGWAFDGTSCASFSGCDCAPDCDLFFPGPVACASACAAVGECREDIVEGVALAQEPIGPGSLCDQVDACVDSPELKGWLTELFPGLSCDGSPLDCDAETCQLQFQSVLTKEEWTQICAATLLPGIEQIGCVVFGP